MQIEAALEPRMHRILLVHKLERRQHPHPPSSRFFTALERTRSFSVVGGKLILRDASGKTIAQLARQD